MADRRLVLRRIFATTRSRLWPKFSYLSYLILSKNHHHHSNMLALQEIDKPSVSYQCRLKNGKKKIVEKKPRTCSWPPFIFISPCRFSISFFFFFLLSKLRKVAERFDFLQATTTKGKAVGVSRNFPFYFWFFSGESILLSRFYSVGNESSEPANRKMTGQARVIIIVTGMYKNERRRG